MTVLAIWLFVLTWWMLVITIGSFETSKEYDQYIRTLFERIEKLEECQRNEESK
jgi:hypothetical protein